MVNWFHRHKNAENALDLAQNYTYLDGVVEEEGFFYARLRLTITDDTTLSSIRGVDQTLRTSGFEEVTDEYNTSAGQFVYEWDYSNFEEYDIDGEAEAPRTPTNATDDDLDPVEDDG